MTKKRREIIYQGKLWALDHYDMGESVMEIAKDYGVSKLTIYNWIKKYSDYHNSNDSKEELKEILGKMNDENNNRYSFQRFFRML